MLSCSGARGYVRSFFMSSREIPHDNVVQDRVVLLATGMYSSDSPEDVFNHIGLYSVKKLTGMSFSSWLNPLTHNNSSRPIHKKVCKNASSAIPKLLNGLIANPLLNHFLQIAFIKEFRLDEEPIVDRPFIAKSKVVLEPSDMGYLMRLVMDSLSDEELSHTEGMLQMRTFERREPVYELDHTRLELWKNSRKVMAELGYAGQPVGLVDFCMKSTIQTITFAILIEKDAFDRVKAGVGYILESAIMPMKRDVPLSCQACIE